MRLFRRDPPVTSTDPELDPSQQVEPEPKKDRHLLLFGRLFAFQEGDREAARWAITNAQRRRLR